MKKKRHERNAEKNTKYTEVGKAVKRKKKVRT